MNAKKSKAPCLICNPGGAVEGDYCEAHRQELHRLEHLYEGLFRLQRAVRGKDHEAYDIYMQSQCDPCGRVLIQETDPDNLAITVLFADDINLDEEFPEYTALGIRQTRGDVLRHRISLELVQSWYGGTRACVDLFRVNLSNRVHWDLDPAADTLDNEDADPTEPHSHGGKCSIH